MSTSFPSRAAIPEPISSTSRPSTQTRALFAVLLAAAIVGGFVATSPAASV